MKEKYQHRKLKKNTLTQGAKKDKNAKDVIGNVSKKKGTEASRMHGLGHHTATVQDVDGIASDHSQQPICAEYRLA